ncbi:uncharacterized protein [Eurosta solidaginis]|uniref:uncharacterized protein n=1 Tax=Eurosta solidaginis TaxID=178769 RepID=UPI00353166FF
MMSVSNYEDVFLVGCYVNSDAEGVRSPKTKPEASNIFLQPLVDDLKVLLQQGFYYDENAFSISIGAFVCDSPARAFILNIKSHSGYYCCSKCTHRGERYMRKITFPSNAASMRTDSSFKEKLQKEHHLTLDQNLLETINVGCVTQFPIDYMHCVCLGVTRQLVKLWVKNKNESYSLSKSQIENLSFENIVLKKQFSSEFPRVPRTIDELDRWKATEYRSFLLYSGPYVLQNKLDEKRYRHFCKLHFATRILCHPELCCQFNNVAKELLEEFVNDFVYLYGQEFVTYNCHSLKHLYGDVLKYGSLNHFSAFKYENYLYQLKKTIKKGSNVLAQISNRVIEKSSIIKQETRRELFPILKGALKDNTFRAIICELFKLSARPPDNYFCVNKRVYILTKITAINNDICIFAKEVKNLQRNDFESRSWVLNIYETNCLLISDNEEKFNLTNIDCKYLYFYIEGYSKHCFIPLLKNE